MTQWLKHPTSQVDVEILEEAALAMAQSTIQSAMDAAGLSKAELARKLKRQRSFISVMLSGRHNLTVKTMSRSLAACGYELRFNRVPLVWNWRAQRECARPEKHQPAQAGTTIPVVSEAAGIVVSA